MHSQEGMDDVVRSLGNVARRVYGDAKTVRISAQSSWVDKTPQAYSGTPIRNVELADLLVVVTRKVGNLPAPRYVVLLQGKCVDRPDRLAAATCKSGSTSALKERDLLETRSGEIEVKCGNSCIGKYDLESEGLGTRGIGDFVRYLLIPNRNSSVRGSWSYPYLTLWPSSRRSSTGDREVAADSEAAADTNCLALFVMGA